MDEAARVVAVLAGGGAGAVARYAVGRWAAGFHAVQHFPWHTFGINVLGSFALGVLAGAGVGGDPRFLVGGGLLGAFTTFSTWMLETQRLAEEGEGRLALANLGLSVALGLAAVGAGWWAGSLL